MSISLQEVLALEVFKESTFLAGLEGKNNYVRWVTILEVLDEIDQLEPGEFLITTAFDLQKNKELRKQIIKLFHERELSGIAIQTGYYLEKVPEEMLEQANKYGFPIIEIPRTTTFSEITKTVHRHIINKQFEKIRFSEEMYKRLTEIALSNQGLPPIAQAVCNLINGEILIFDNNMNKLCSTSQHSSTISNHQLVENIYSFKEEFEQASLSHKKIMIDDWQVFISPVKSKNSTHGYIIGIKKSSFNEFEEIAIQHASTICALEFIKLSSLEQKDIQLKADFLEMILTGNYEDELTIHSQGRALGYKLGVHATCITIIQIDQYETIEEWEKIESKLLQTTLRLFQEHGLQTLFKLFTGQFVMLITNRWPDKVNINDVLERVSAEVHQKYGITLSIGIGNYYTDVKKYKYSYKEAQEALFILKTVWKKNKILHHRDLGLYKLLYPLLETKENINLTKQYYQQILGDLLEQEELLTTLQTYFSCLKINEAAEELFIHRHTLTYRLKKIEEITNKNINHFQDRLELELALTFYNMFK